MLAVGFLLMISMLLAAGLSAMGKYWGGALPEPLMHALAFTVSFLTTSAMFALIFKWMPDAEVDWQDVILGAVGTAALFEIGKFVISFYIGKQGLELDLRRLGVDRRRSYLGLLFGTNLVVRRRVYPCSRRVKGVLGLPRAHDFAADGTAPPRNRTAGRRRFGTARL